MSNINGWVSRKVLFTSGVRQGCPLAPLLYLFVAQALLSWLKAEAPTAGLGTDVAGDRLVATQFADDTEVVLGSVAAWPHFAELMRTFGAASGQRASTGPRWRCCPSVRAPRPSRRRRRRSRSRSRSR